MSQSGQITAIAGAIIGYLPAARIAEFQYESAGATICAIVETGETRGQAIESIPVLRCQVVIEPRTPAGRDDQDTLSSTFA